MTKPNLYQDPKTRGYESAHTYAHRTGISVRKARRRLRRLVNNQELIFIKRNNTNEVIKMTRLRFGFLFFPKKIRGETRWLVFARWQEIGEGDGGGAMGGIYWSAHCWL
jgi:hypothetical protein